MRDLLPDEVLTESFNSMENTFSVLASKKQHTEDVSARTRDQQLSRWPKFSQMPDQAIAAPATTWKNDERGF
jgi:hypothetical protein